MQLRQRIPFSTIRAEGALLPIDLLQRVAAGDNSLAGLTPEAYHLHTGEKLNELSNLLTNPNGHGLFCRYLG